MGVDALVAQQRDLNRWIQGVLDFYRPPAAAPSAVSTPAAAPEPATPTISPRAAVAPRSARKKAAPREKSRGPYQAHHDKHGVILRCQVCTTTFTKVENLCEHLKEEGSCRFSKGTTECTCGYQPQKVAAYRTHRYNYSKEKRVSCTTCGKGFALIGSLNVHMLRHGEERKFPCTKGCGRSYKQGSSLRRHLLSCTGRGEK